MGAPGVSFTSEQTSPEALVECVREARDGLLTLASSEDVSSADLSTAPKHSGGSADSFRSSATAVSSGADTGNAGRKPPKPPRKTSLSYWTPESLDSLEPPKRLGSKNSAT